MAVQNTNTPGAGNSRAVRPFTLTEHRETDGLSGVKMLCDQIHALLAANCFNDDGVGPFLYDQRVLYVLIQQLAGQLSEKCFELDEELELIPERIATVTAMAAASKAENECPHSIEAVCLPILNEIRRRAGLMERNVGDDGQEDQEEVHAASITQ
jgi:hypothetical protein